MKWLRGWLMRLGGIFGGERQERELAAEMESHLQMHIEDNLRAGMSAAEARREAIMKLGGVEQTKEIYRDRRGLPLLERFEGSALRKCGCTGDAIIEEEFNGCERVSRNNAVAQAPAGHGVNFRETIHEENTIENIGYVENTSRAIGVVNLGVDLVGENQEVVLAR